MAFVVVDTGLYQDLDAMIAEAQAPIQRMEQEFAQAQREWTEKIAQAQRLSQDLNASVDKIDHLGKRVER